ncbi:MAG: response regulator [Eubacteriales bacterium]|nr:response regulator [Eubacteriales bacterium]
MLKLFIVDDEPIILSGLLNTYPWERWGFTPVGSATKGRTALTLIEKLQPDVVIADVRMKDMTGLEVLEQAMENHPSIVFIMISAYRDFQYAQKACQLGAYSYLLKPLDEKELQKTMLEVAEHILQKQTDSDLSDSYHLFLTKHSYHYERSLLRSYVQGYMETNEFTDAFSFTNPGWKSYRVAAVSLGIDISMNILKYRSGHYILLQYIQSHRHELPFGYAFERPDGGLSYFLVLKQGEHFDRRSLEILFENFQKEFHLGVVYALSKEYPSLLDARQAAAEADFLLKIADDAGLDQLYPENAAEELAATTPSPAGYPEHFSSLILRCIQSQNYPAAKKNLEKFVFALSGNHSIAFQKACLLRLTTEIYTTFYQSALLSASLRENFEDLIDSFPETPVLKTIPAIHQLIRALIPPSAPPTANSYVEKAKLYAQEHLADEYLNITTVSEMLFLNPVYFGKLFKKATGKGFKAYLLELRIAYAKRQLTTTSKSISAICQEIGIPNASYFSQLFKASEGVLPTEYRKERLL